MKVLYHDRLCTLPDSTVGMMTGENMRRLFVLEDEHHDIKIKGDTRIPAGAYFLKFNKVVTPLTSKYRKRFPWFTFHIEITGIKNFSNVYYHIGNDEGDTAGCPLLGLVCDMSSGEGIIQRSTQAFEIFYKTVSPWLMSGEEVIVNITDPR